MELNSNQVKALEMISAEFVDDIRLIREGITGDDLNYMEMVNLIDWDADKQAYIMLDAGNRELYARNKHPLQLMDKQEAAMTQALENKIAGLNAIADILVKQKEMSDSFFEAIEGKSDRIAALEAENAALKAQNAELRQRNGALALIADQATKERDELRGLLDEAKQVIAPIARNERFFVRFKELGMPKADRTKSLFDYSGTYFQYIVNPINAIKVGDIIDAAEFASKLAAKLDEQSK